MGLLRDLFAPREFVHLAFATCLKQELDPFLRETYGISAFTNDNAEKQIIRPHLVARGAGARQEDPHHWIKILEPAVIKSLTAGHVTVIEDCRYLNEANWIKSLGGKVVYVERIQHDGTPVPPANEEEALNDPLVRQAADITVTLPTLKGDLRELLKPYAERVFKQLIS